MEMTPELFRDALGRLAAGVTVVTTRDAAGEPRGLTATAVCSVSLDPPLVLACIDRDSLTGEAIRSSRRYALNFLHFQGRDLSKRFASAGDGKFDGLVWSEGSHGCPVLADCLTCVECEVEREVDAGDHTIFVGRVLHLALEPSDLEPLIHYRGRYRTLRDESGE